ncbi:MAG: PDZ domain-containing protein, partial [Sphingomonas sp.]
MFAAPTASALPAEAPNAAYFAALRAADLRVAAIGYRLTTANAALCRDLQPQLGMPIQALDQYGAAARTAADMAFGFEAGVAVEDVVPNAPAMRAGVRAGDSLISLNGSALPAKPMRSDSAATADTRLAVEHAIAALSPNGPLTIGLRHGGHDRAVTVTPVAGCRTGIELMIGPGFDADSDGEKIRIGSRFVETFDDADVAGVIAHELAHTILAHRKRLEAAKV